jgi:hypothetical protein
MENSVLFNKLDKYANKLLINSRNNIYQQKFKHYINHIKQTNQIGGSFTAPNQILLGKFFYTDIDESLGIQERLVFETQKPTTPNDIVYPTPPVYTYYYLNGFTTTIVEKTAEPGHRYKPHPVINTAVMKQAITNLKHNIIFQKGILAFNIENLEINRNTQNQTSNMTTENQGLIYMTNLINMRHTNMNANMQNAVIQNSTNFNTFDPNSSRLPSTNTGFGMGYGMGNNMMGMYNYPMMGMY